jgi:S-adenosylmethionine decarboxylase proenzyme
MFSEESIKSSGKHLVCDIKQIKNIDLVRNLEGIKSVMDSICNTYDYHVLQKIEHTFQPEGFSVIYLLSESHMTIHTFVEKQYVAFDLYTCRQYPDNKVYQEIYDFLIDRFDALREPPIIVDRKF